MTVRRGAPNSHADLWEPYTRNVLKVISDQCDGVAFILLGNVAHKLGSGVIDTSKHYVIEAPHPSRLENGILAARPFFRAERDSGRALPRPWP